jgi:hypothetical protein
LAVSRLNTGKAVQSKYGLQLKGRLKRDLLSAWVLGESNPRRALIEIWGAKHMDGARQPIDPFLSVFRDRIVWFHRREANKCQPVSKVGTTSGINV